jgi:flagellin-specific chaperone FliS
MFKKIVFVSVVLILWGCQQEKSEWNPIFEQTNFNYLNASIERSMALIEEASSEADNKRTEAIQEKLDKVRNQLLAIKDYYIPLTTVRQKIFDADRYFKLNRKEETERLLNASKAIIASLDLTVKNEVFDKVIIDLDAMIEEAIASLDENSKQNTYNKMKKLGEHVNLMLNKGELVLSGIEFDK